MPGPLRHSYVRRATAHAHTIPNLKPEIWTKHCVTPSSISYVSYFISLSSLSLILLEPDQSSSMYGDFGVMISGRRKARADRSERVTDRRTSRSSVSFDGGRERMRIRIRYGWHFDSRADRLQDTAASGTAGNQPPHRTRNAASTECGAFYSTHPPIPPTNVGQCYEYFYFT
eukprot:COSAG01_NODE_70_length_28755_cov_34.709067_13_plen_172_part_00